MTLKITENQLDNNGYWDRAIDSAFVPNHNDLALFDQNGYDLTDIEQLYAVKNDRRPQEHRSKHRMSIKQEWFTQDTKIEGAVLNHSFLFERKGYSGLALDQLKSWAKDFPLVYKIISMRPKWGLDFSMDWVDREGNAFEVLHWEYDGFSYEEITSVKNMIEPILLSIDFDQAGRKLLDLKSEWHSLNFFAQSDYKCDFFNIPKERFKMVIWS